MEQIAVSEDLWVEMRDGDALYITDNCEDGVPVYYEEVLRLIEALQEALAKHQGGKA
jgi:hypothetical protein